MRFVILVLELVDNKAHFLVFWRWRNYCKTNKKYRQQLKLKKKWEGSRKEKLRNKLKLLEISL